MEQAAFLARVRVAMKERKLNQGDLARAAKITSQSAVSGVFKGTRRLKIEEKAAWEKLLGLTPERPGQWIPLLPFQEPFDWSNAAKTPVRDSLMPTAGPLTFAVEITPKLMRQLLPAGGWIVVDPQETSLFHGNLYLVANDKAVTRPARYETDPARFVALSGSKQDVAWDIGAHAIKVIGRIIAYGANA